MSRFRILPGAMMLVAAMTGMNITASMAEEKNVNIRVQSVIPSLAD